MTPEPEWVDLGLPSGLLWRRRNLGADNPTTNGLYFSWGNIDGHSPGDGYNFTQEVYAETPGAAISSNLDISQDAARVVLGGPWRMPTKQEFKELADNCTAVWTSIGGVYGRLFTSNINGNQLFFPASGDWAGASLVNVGSGGHYWSSTYETAVLSPSLFFNSSQIYPEYNDSRRLGFVIRPVCEP